MDLIRDETTWWPQNACISRFKVAFSVVRTSCGTFKNALNVFCLEFSNEKERIV